MKIRDNAKLCLAIVVGTMMFVASSRASYRDSVFNQDWEYVYGGTGDWYGTATWEKATNWYDYTGTTPYIITSGSPVPQVPNSGLKGSCYLDVNNFFYWLGVKNVTATTLDGTNFKVGLANGTTLTVGEFVNRMSNWNVYIDSQSKLVINGWNNNIILSGTNAFHIDSINGLSCNAYLPNATIQFYLGENGSVYVKNRINGATKVSVPEVKINVATTGAKRVSSRTIINYNGKIGDFNFSNFSASEVGGLPLMKQDSVAVTDKVGAYAFSQSATALTIQWVEGNEGGGGDDPIIDPTEAKGVIAINFNSLAKQINQQGGVNYPGDKNNQVTGNDSGALDYAIPVAGWLQVDEKSGEGTANVYDFTSQAIDTSRAATVSWTSANVWSYKGMTAKILNGYLDDSNEGAAVSVKNIPFNKYDVIFYAATDSGSMKFGAPEINGKRYTYANGETVEGDATWGASQSKIAVYGTNALRVKGLSGDLTVKGYGDNSAGYRGCIAAIEIVDGEEVSKKEYTYDKFLTKEFVDMGWKFDLEKLPEATITGQMSGSSIANRPADSNGYFAKAPDANGVASFQMQVYQYNDADDHYLKAVKVELKIGDNGNIWARAAGTAYISLDIGPTKYDGSHEFTSLTGTPATSPTEGGYGVASMTIVIPTPEEPEYVFENTDCDPSDPGYGNYMPATLKIPESADLPAGTKLRIKSVTFAMRVNSGAAASYSAEYLTINGVQSESRNGLDETPEEWSLGNRMTYEFKKDAIVTVGEAATLGTVQGKGGNDNIRIYIFRTTEEKYSHILLTTAMETYRPVYKIVAEKYVAPTPEPEGRLYYDWTFDGTALTSRGLATPVTLTSEGTPVYLEDEEFYTYDKALNTAATPWGNITYPTTTWSAMVSGIMPTVKGNPLVTFGTKKGGEIGLIAGDSEEEVLLIRTTKDEEYSVLDSVTVENAQSATHVYVIVRKADCVKLYVDGALELSVDVDDVQIGGGLQVGSVNGGITAGLTKVDANNVGHSAIEAIRIYQNELTESQFEALSEEFPVREIESREPTTIYWKGGDGVIDYATVFEDEDGNEVKYISGDEVIIEGSAKITLARGLGEVHIKNGAVLQIASDSGAVSKLYIDEGAVFDVNGVADKAYPIVLNGGTLANYGSAIDDNKKQYWNLEVTADSFIDAANEFGTIASGYNAQTLNLGGWTLTKRGAGNFYIANATFVGGGSIDIEEGAVVLMKGTTMPDDLTVKVGANGETIAAGTGFAINSGKIIFDISRMSDKQNEIMLLAAAGQEEEDFALAEGTDENWEIQVNEAAVKAINVYTLVKLGGRAYPTLAMAFTNIKSDGEVLEIVDTERLTFEGGTLILDGEAVDLTQYAVTLLEEGGVITVSRLMEGGELTIAEICPKPTAKDPNGVEAGWVELVNIGTGWAELSDYSFVRVNRGKKLDIAKALSLPSRAVAPNSRVRFYTTEGYVVGDDLVFVEPKMTADATAEIEGVLVYPAKINPKKYPMVTLTKGGETICSVVIPCDTPDDATIIVEPLDETVLGGATRHYLKVGAKLTAIGPEVGPLYGVKHDFTDINATPPAIPGENYAITLDVNPVYGGGEMDAIEEVYLVYRTDLDEETRKEVAMEKGEKISGHGQQWTAEIPFDDFPEAGHLIQWKAKIVDAAGNVWYAPQFLGPDDGYEWYGTIVEPTEEQLSETLTTFHLFADAETADDKDAPNRNMKVMNIDYDEFMSGSQYAELRTRHPYGARVAFYDSSTSQYYDNVRVDLRGNSSKGFNKKSHGLRFGKTHPLSTFDCVSGKTIEIRKSSFIAEFGDPSFLRQMTAFWLFNKHKSPAPFHYPARLNLNGKFYQLGFHSERFTDELIEDCYGLDPLGYGYKNIGTFGNGTSAGGIEKKTPDDGNEGDLSVLNAFCNTLPNKIVTSDDDHAKYTKIVAEKMDIPAWINYIALTKITQECDDVWANLSGYYDNPQLIDGVRPGSTGTWRPLAYDMQLTFGQWHHADYSSFYGLMSNQDWFKSHPLYGGYAVRARKGAGGTTAGNANRAYEAIFQNEKFRRLFLRRLRTLMDEELCAPDTTGEETWQTSTINFMVQMRKMAALMGDEAEMDHAQWGYCNGASNINVWGNNYPKTIEEAIGDIWDNYVVPHRVHLYETHAASNIEKEIGYGENLIAGIPEEQTAIVDLKAGFSAEYNETIGAVVIRNANEETIDLSNWELSGPINMTIPEGTVIDMAIDSVPGEVYVTADRRATVAAFGDNLLDQIIVGNGTNGSAEEIGLVASDGTDVLAVEKSEQERYLRLWGFAGAPDGASTDENEFIIFTNLCETASLDATRAHIQFEKAGATPEGRCSFDLPEGTVIEAGGWVRFNQADVPWTKITDGFQDITLTAANGIIIEKYENLDQSTIIGGKGSGKMAVHNLETDEWYAILITEAPGYDPPPPPPPVDLNWANTNVTEKITLAPGYTYNFANANFLGGLELPAGEYEIKNDGKDSVNTAAFVSGAGASITFVGKGKFEVTGEGITEPLFTAKDLYITKGTFAIDVSTATAKTAAVSLTGNFGLSGEGKLTMNLAGTQPVGIELTNKKMSADFEAGAFTATLGGTKASAFKFKGSDAVTFSCGTMDVEITGTGAKVLNGGTIVFEDGYVCNIEGEETATDATVFEAGKTLTVNGGIFNISVPGAGSQILTTADDPEEKDLTLTINGGTFNLLAGDDCVKSAGNDAVTDPESVNTKRNVVINGGNFYGVSTGNDVIDSNGDIIITGGNILAYTTAVEDDGYGSTGLDVNEGRIIDVQGGNVIALGGPNSSFHYDGGMAFTADELDATEYSEKFVELDGKGRATLTRVWAKLPELTVDTISLFCFTPGIDPTVTPAASDETPPQEYATGFHDLYICEHYSPDPDYRYYYYTATMPDEDFPAEWVDQLTDMPADVVLVLSGEGPNGFKYSKSGNVTFNNLHIIFESGMHNFTRINGGQTTQFANGATPENPTFLVKDDATLTIQAKDFSGWNCTVDTTGIIRVNDGGTLNLVNDGGSTFFFSQQLYLDAGAQVNVTQNSADRFRVNGGIDRATPQIYMPPSEGGVATITMTDGLPLNVGKDNHPNCAIFVGDGSTLVIDGDIQGLPTNETGRELVKYGTGKLKITGKITNVTYTEAERPTLCKIDGHSAGAFEEALRFLSVEGSILEIVDEDRMSYDGGELIIDGQIVDLKEKKLKLTEEDGVLILRPDVMPVAGSILYISEIMPKPTDALERGTLEGMDPNGLESGWVELENPSDCWVDLADYRFIRVNRSKKLDTAGYGNFPHQLVAPHSKVVFYTSERYANSADMTVSAFATPVDAEKPTILSDELHGLIVWPNKVNPKKSPFVRLYYAPDESTLEVVDTVVIPSDLPEGASIIVGRNKDGEATARWICEAPTKGLDNPSTDGLVKIGPNVGPLYEIASGKKTGIASEFDLPVPPAKLGEDYVITFAANPVMNPSGGMTARNEDTFTKIELIYRTDLDNETLKTVDVDISSPTFDKSAWGNQYTVTIPKESFPEAGHLIQWKFLLTDNAGNEWMSPSFHNHDDGYEWYGTIVEPTAEQLSENLTTWHMFAEEGVADKPGDGNASYLMNKDSSDSGYITPEHPNGARVAIYDSSTSNYYDYVRIDLRGNTTASFKKKSHGLRFAKAHPLTTNDCLSGEDVEEIRKSSLIAEYADPTFMRQMMAFWVFNKNGSKAPFDFPVRVNMNGKFYQLAFHSERFTDELIEDVYGLDKYCYSYKSIGTWGAAGTAGGIEKKTPDDENESDVSVLTKFTSTLPTKLVESEADQAKYTKIVSEKMDIPSWFNYMALSRITYETDDIWANLCGYLDDPTMMEGHRGTGAWYPLGYDMNLSFGQYFHQVDCGGLSADEDWFKAHPFYGGFKVRAYKNADMLSVEGNANHAYEAIYQNEKFRRLYLRRLRTLMDKELGAPNEEETLENSTIPFVVKMREFAALINADAEMDRKIWGFATNSQIDVWRGGTEPKSVQAGLEDLWENYVVPRREHLYVTHSIDAENVGYGSTFAAGIPYEQSAIVDLRDGITAEYDATIGAVVIRNANEETIDLSDWELSGPVSMTIPAGTVIDQAIDGVLGEVYVTADRRATIAAMTITDQVIVGNGEKNDIEAKISLTAADGTKVIFEPSPVYNYLRLHSFDGVPPLPSPEGDTEEWICVTNISDSVELDLAGVEINFIKQGDAESKCNFTIGAGVVLPAGGSITFKQSEIGWTKITNNKLYITITDVDGVKAQDLAVTQKDFKNYYGEGGPGGEYYLQATTFAQDSEIFVEVAYPKSGVIVEPGKPAIVEAESAEEAIKKSVLVVETPVIEGLSEETYKGYFKLVAEKLEGETNKFIVMAELNPEVVPAPQIDALNVDGEAMTMQTTESAATIIVSIINAKLGLWYGYEATGDLGVDFVNDVGSFKQATNIDETLTLESTPREGDKGFFRVKVLEKRPEE